MNFQQELDGQLRHEIARREFLSRGGLGLGLGSVALGSLLAQDGTCGESATPNRANPLAPKSPHYSGKAKAVIQLFMAGGPSQLELFEPKPTLNALHNQPIPQSFIEGKRFAFLKGPLHCLGSNRKFARHGESGAWVSELLPHIAGISDHLAFIKTMHTENFNHGPAKLITQTGVAQFGRPSIGSWVVYGLGSESQQLPGYVVLASGPRGPRGSSYLWSNGFLSSIYQGVPLRTKGEPILNLTSPQGITPARQRRALDALGKLNSARLAATGDDEIAARISSYEMAYRMQSSAPELIDLAQETPETLALYGAVPGEASFANNCLLARRLVERGVRHVTLFHTEWDHHGGTENLESSIEVTCRQVDQATAALVKDLQRRGLLDSTLVVWGGEFGRTPMGEDRKPIGRDHHIDAYTVWLTGGGIKGGQTLGSTDEIGYNATEPGERVAVHDLQATMLHLLGLDHLKLTYRFEGRDFRLTDVAGKVIQQLLAS